MSFHNPIVAAGLAGLVKLFAARAVSPVEATQVYLDRIARLDPGLGAVVAVDAPGALADAAASAARWREGRPRSLVDGAPIAVKANIAVAGLPWTSGIGAYGGRIATEDAAVVARLRAAGAVILGALNMHEGALGATTDNRAYGRCHNPHRQGFTPGGSSGGSAAAVAAGLCAAALGTDTMGSVRIPSAYCGVFGFKPAHGFLSTDGVEPLSWTFDHVGVHARSVEDLRVLTGAASCQALAAGTPTRPLAALDFAGQVEVAPEVAAAFEDTVEAARAAGFSVSNLRLDELDFGRLRRLGLLVCEAEAAVVHEAALVADPEGFSEDFRGLLAWASRQSAPKLAKAYRDLEQAAAHARIALTPYAALLTPTAPQAAFAFDDGAPVNQADFTALAAFMGVPALAFPTGVSDGGLPLSAQVVARDPAVALTLACRLSAAFATVPTPEGFRA